MLHLSLTIYNFKKLAGFKEVYVQEVAKDIRNIHNGFQSFKVINTNLLASIRGNLVFILRLYKALVSKHEYKYKIN